MAEAAAAPACDGGTHNEDDKERVIRSEVHHGDHGADSAAEEEEEEEEEESKGLRTTAYRFRLLQVDADGDAVVPRRRRRREDEGDEQDGNGVLTIHLQHRTATTLRYVGQQLWRGALLLSEALLARRDELQGRTIVELGAGVGLVSIVAARAAAPAVVYLTDMDDEAVLALARANVAANGCGDSDRIVRVAALDWEAAAPQEEEDGSIGGLVEPPHIVLAADVVYDDQLTDAFFEVLCRLLCTKKGPACPEPYCLLALERRPIFSTKHMAVVAHGYDRFREHLAWGLDQTPRPLEGRQLPVDAVPIAYVGAEGSGGRWRGGEGDDGLLELWEIRPRRGSLDSASAPGV